MRNAALCTKTFVDTTKYFVVASVPMKQDPRNQPTPSELELLQILWARGPSTVREIHEELSKEKDVGYTSALKLLQIMTTKGYVTRTEDQRAHVYAAIVEALMVKSLGPHIYDKLIGQKRHRE